MHKVEELEQLRQAMLADQTAYHNAIVKLFKANRDKPNPLRY